VTSRQHTIEPHTHKFISAHYPSTFHSINFANHFLTEEEATRLSSKSKTQICKEIGAEILIDDSLNHAHDCAENGIRVLLFDLGHKYGWNKSKSLPKNVNRVKNWKEIVELLVDSQ